MFLSDLSIKQPVLATMLAVSLVTLGLYSYRQLSIDQFPDVEIPVLTVQTAYPGAAPETVEREVTKRIEEALNTISGVRHMSSTSTESLSMVVAEFRLGTSIHTAQQDAQAKINAGEPAAEVLSLAHYFCRSARSRIDHHFAGTSNNADKLGYDLTQELLAGKHDNLRRGIV